MNVEMTENDLKNLLKVAAVESINEVKEHYENDFSEFVDTNLSEIYDTLLYNEFENEEIEKRVNARYGAVIDVYHALDQNCFYMFFGVR